MKVALDNTNHPASANAPTLSIPRKNMQLVQVSDTVSLYVCMRFQHTFLYFVYTLHSDLGPRGELHG